MISETILIFEPLDTGHRIDYLNHLIKYNNYCSLHLLLGFYFDEKKLETYGQKNLSVTKLSKKVTDLLLIGNNVVNSIVQYFVILTYVRRLNISIVYMLTIDKLYNILALLFPFPKNLKISGIIFRADFHYPDVFGTSVNGLKNKLNYYRKKKLLKRTAKNKHIKTLFTLDETLAPYANKLWDVEVFRYLPDPALSVTATLKKPSFNTFDDSYIKLFFFGNIDYRKGIIQLLDSFEFIDQETMGKIQLIIQGKLELKLKDIIVNKINELIAQKKANILLLQGYLPTEELAYLVKNSDLILCPYIRQPGSSGVLLWAAGYNKPVITQDYGLIGYLTKKYKLGMTIDTTDPTEIAQSIENYVRNSRNLLYVDKSLMLQYASSKTPESFSKVTFEGLLGKY